MRVLREELNGSFENSQYQPQRLLIVIWPLFMLRSLLTIDVVATNKGSPQHSYKLNGKGHEPIELQIAGTHKTDHELLFDTKFVFFFCFDK